MPSRAAGKQALIVGRRPPVEHPLADRGHDADWYREALKNSWITPCITARKGRKIPIQHDKGRYRKRHKIENSLARLKDRRRIATRCDRCPKVFPSTCGLAAVVLFWI